ncbi:hypothetical protein ACFLV4_05030 [Chloroflexota bacterium]
MIKLISLLVTILMLSLPVSVSAAEPGQGIVEGQLVNRTEGSSSVANQDITLKTRLDNAEVGSISAKTDAEGRFGFNSLSTEPGYSYQATSVFQEAEYNSEWLSFANGETTNFIEFTVYDATTNDEAIKMAIAHTVIYVEPEGFRIQEYFVFVNEADRTYIGSNTDTSEGEKQTLKFFLPKNATELEYALGLMGCCIITSQKGFVDTMPVLPGAKEIAYSYKVNHSPGSYTFSREVTYPTLRHDLLVQGEGIEVNSNQLATKGQVDMNGTIFQHYSGSNFASGDVLVAQFSGIPQTNSQGAMQWVVLTLIVLMSGFVFIYLLRKKRPQPGIAKDNLSQTKRRLLIELAQLDDEFEAGRISEDVYCKLRKVRKTQLLELMQKSKEESDSR